MADLIAEGSEPQHRWRITLQPERNYSIGRDKACDLPVPWDACISHKHVELHLRKDGIHVRRLEAATNPIFVAGQEVQSCLLNFTEHFVIGGTSFMVSETLQESPRLPVQPIGEFTFSADELKTVRFQDPDRRIDVLSHLPEVIWGARTDQELYVRLVAILLAGILHAEAAAIVHAEDGIPAKLLHWERRTETAGAFRPSTKLVQAAVLQQKQSVLHIWESSALPTDFTMTHGSDWAFCTPVQGMATEGWGLYIAGRFDRSVNGPQAAKQYEHRLQGDVKFAELMADIISSVRRLNHLERQESRLRQFLPPGVISALGDNLDTDLLEPRECDLTVLFCDLRGFSKQAEEARDDLFGLLDRVSQALGVMTRHIRAHGGVIGDFQGDAAMGFWGWPVGSEESPLDACRAALDIRASFAAAAAHEGHPLSGFRMGIGLVHGRAVAGKIGTSEYTELTAFGPVVNLASRLEGMTKQLRVPILIDESLAEFARSELPVNEARTRRLAKVLPYGMETSLTVSELLPSERDFPELSTAHLQSYETAVDRFIEGDWDAAYRALHDIPPHDRAQDFLAMLIAQHNRTAPADWTGIVKLPKN